MRVRSLLLAAAAPALGLLAACQPVPGDANDITPPTISFRLGTRVVTGGVALASLPAEGITVVAGDPGGMTSLDVTNIAVFDCLALGRREIQSAQLIDIPATRYDPAVHAYRGPNGDFWPDVDGDGVNDPAEHGLRHVELSQRVDLEYFQSINGIDGSACTVTDGSAGTSTVRYVLVEAYATNYRASILASDAAEAYAELIIFVA